MDGLEDLRLQRADVDGAGVLPGLGNTSAGAVVEIPSHGRRRALAGFKSVTSAEIPSYARRRGRLHGLGAG